MKLIVLLLCFLSVAMAQVKIVNTPEGKTYPTFNLPMGGTKGCLANKDCGEGLKCIASQCKEPKYVINPDLTVEAPEMTDAKCTKNSDCGKDGTCMAGICFASNKLRFARRSAEPEPQGLVCHSDADCWDPEGGPGKCFNGICISPDKLKRSPEPEPQGLVCHSDADCWDPEGGPGKCFNGICVSPDKLKRSPEPEPQGLVCHSDADCWDPEGGPGKCFNGICISPDKLKARSFGLNGGLIWPCKSDKGCEMFSTKTTPAKCINSTCHVPNLGN